MVIGNGSANPVLTVGLSGTGVAPAVTGPVTISPGSLTFSEFGVAQNLTLSNFGNTQLTINGVGFTANSGYTQTNNCGSALPAQSICTIAVTASETSGNAVLTVVDDAVAGPQTVNLSYTLSGLDVPTYINFGGWSIGAKGSIVTGFGLPQKGDEVYFSISGPNASDFSAVGNDGIGCIYMEGTTCVPTISFTPSGLGTRTATLDLSMSGPGSSGAIGSIALTGTGQPAGINFLIKVTNQAWVTHNNTTIDYTLNPFPFYDDYVNIGSSTTFGVINTVPVPVTVNPPVMSGANAGQFLATDNCSTLAVAATCTLTVTTAPTQLGPLSATIGLTDSTNTVQRTEQVTDVGIASPPTVSASTLRFETQVGSQSAAQPVTITAFQNDPITATVSGDFILTQGSTCSQTPCQLYVAFTPTGAYQSQGSLQIFDPVAGQGAGVTLVGTGDPAPPPPSTVGLSPSSLRFPSRAVGTTSISQSVTVTNTGNQVLYVYDVSLAGTNAGDYLVSNGCPSTLAVGTNCSFTVSFAPTAAGTRTANVQVETNALSSPDVVQLSGTAY